MCQKSSSARCLAVLLTGLVWPGHVFASSLQGSEWKPVLMGGIAVPQASAAFVQFGSKGRLEGHSGCNRLFIEYEVDESHIFVGPVAATRMACEDSMMAHEAALASALENARTYQRMRHKLVLFDQAGKPILEMRQTDWD